MRRTVWTALALVALVACHPAPHEPARATPAGRGPASGVERTDAEAHYRVPAAVPTEAAVPAPATMDADLVVSGLTATMQKIDMVHVGRNVPKTYAGDRVGNSPGFTWWVSKHFALKTDRTEDHARLYLELLELTYPYYVEHFGDEPPRIDHTRIPVVYASSWNQAREAMIDDGILRGPSGGGETMYFNKVAYSFPSFYEEHQRYIVIHETTHAFQMCLTGESRLMPTWFTEGIADSLAHHVYDPKAHQLTVMAFDRGTKDYLQHGLDEYAADGRPTLRAMNDSPKLRRGLNFLMIHYLLDDVSRNARFSVWRDELIAQRLHGKPMVEASAELLEQLYGPWDGLERDFASWVATLPKAKTFTVQDEGWEQDGDAFWIRDREAKPRPEMRRIDLSLVPSAKPEPSALRMDYPAMAASPLIARPVRGVDTPSLGALISYVGDRVGRGEVGIGLGREKDDLMTVTVENARWLVIDGTRIGGTLHRHGLPTAVAQALRHATDARLGLSVTIEADALAIRIRTSEAGSADFRVDLTPELRAKLVDRPVSVVAGGADHRIVPFFDDGRPGPEIFGRAAPGNRLRDARIGVARRLAHARWALGDASPQELENAFATLVSTPASGKGDAGAPGLEDLENVVAAVDRAGERRDRALAALAGLRFRLERAADGRLAVRLANASEQAVEGTVEIRDGDSILGTSSISVGPGASKVVPVEAVASGELSARASLVWCGRQLEIVTGAPVLDRAGLKLSARTVRDGELARVHVDLAGPLAAGANGKLEIRTVSEDPIEVVHQVELEAGKGHAIIEGPVVPVGTPIQVTAHLDADGEPLKLEVMAEGA